MSNAILQHELPSDEKLFEDRLDPGYITPSTRDDDVCDPGVGRKRPAPAARKVANTKFAKAPAKARGVARASAPSDARSSSSSSSSSSSNSSSDSDSS